MRRAIIIAIIIFIVLFLLTGGFFFFKYKTELFLFFYKHKTINPITIDGFEFPKEEARQGGAEEMEWWYMPLYLFNKSDSSKKFNVMVAFHRDDLGPQFFIVDIKDQKKSFSVIKGNTKVLSQKKLFLENSKNFLIETSLFKYWLYCKQEDSGFDLKLKALKNPIFIRQNEERKNIDVIQSRISVSGNLFFEGKEYKVDGFGWIYHQSPSQIITGNILGWKWWAVQLSNNKEIIFNEATFRDEEKSVGGMYIIDEGSSGVNFKKLKKEDFILKELDSLRNEELDRTYSTSWELSVPSENINLKIDSMLKNQIVEVGGNVSYEGICNVSGTYKDKTVEGWAYSEQVVLPVPKKQNETNNEIIEEK